MNQEVLNDGAITASSSGWVDRYLPQGNGKNGPNDQSLIDFDLIKAGLFRQRLLILGVVALSLIVGLVVTLLAAPVYKATATVKVDPYGRQIVEGQDLDPGMPASQIDRFFQTQVDLVESKKLALAVTDELKLVDRPEISGIERSRSAAKSPAAKQAARNRAAALLQGGVKANLPFDSQILSISFESEDPRFAARVANAYADAFLRDKMLQRIEANRYALDYLTDEIKKTRTELQKAEFASNDFARQNRIVTEIGPARSTEDDGSAASAGSQTITASNLASLNASYAEAKAKRIAAEQRWRSVSGTPPLQLEQVQENSAIQGLQSTRARVAQELADLRQRYDDSFPKVSEKRAEVASIDAEIAKTGANIKAAIRKDYQIAAAQERALRSEVGSLSDRTLEEQDRQVRYQMLDRNAAALRVQLAALLARFNDLSTAANVQTGSVTKIDPASVPTAPTSPDLFKNLVVALFAGISLAGGLALLREAMDGRLHGIGDAEEKLGVHLLGHTPYVPDSELDEQLENPFSTIREAYSSILLAVDYSLPRSANVIHITSAQSSEGKTTTAVLLARSYARLGRKVLLIDTDMRRPSITKYLDFEDNKPGLVEVLLGHTTCEQAIHSSLVENLDVLAGTNATPNPIQILSSPMLKEFIAKQRAKYSVIILDSAPVIGLADAPLLSQMADATIFVTEANKAHFGQVRSAIRRLQSSGGGIIGAILTKYRPMVAGESYYYGEKYYDYLPDESNNSDDNDL